jgi:hypothetical protein
MFGIMDFELFETKHEMIRMINTPISIARGVKFLYTHIISV